MRRYALLGLLPFFWVLWTVSLRASQLSSQSAPSNSDCLTCHGDPNLSRKASGGAASLFVDERHFRDSMHGLLDCRSCHADIKSLPHNQTPAKVSCSECHKEVHAAYSQGLHARAILNGNQKAANCVDCHGDGHSILPSSNPNSRTSHANIAATCGSCHGQKFVMEGSGLTARPFLSYKESVHGRAVAMGNAKAAVCTDCHGSHDIRPPTDPQSSIFKFSVPRTCGQCHSDISNEFAQSIHGQAIARGNSQSPVCTDCHGIHAIKPHIDPDSSVAAQALARTTCAKCHEGVKLSEEFGVAGKRASSYLDSYHGLASKLGSSIVANCASCHGVHNILPSSDPKSMISQTNLVQTCGACHPGASDNFVLGKVHLDVPGAQDAGSMATRWVRWIYIALIILTIGSMSVHNGLIWRRKALDKKRLQIRTVVRMSANQRVQHLILLTSFAVLVVTGFALKYQNSWLADVVGGSNEAIRRVGHRTAAVVLMLVAIYHVGYVLLTREGRRAVRELLPAWKDVLDLVHNLRYYLGGSSERPKMGRFGYAEKAEYWAVIWGVIVMGLTGLMVWFKIAAFGFLPRWSIDVAMAIHFYEAILATLAIIVWHFYQVIFDPDVYPINWAWWDGFVAEEHFRREHPLAYEQTTQEEPPRRNEPPGERTSLRPDEPAGDAKIDLPAGPASGD